MRRIVALTMLTLLATFLGAAPSQAQKAYISNYSAGTISVVDTTTNAVVGSPITVGSGPYGVAWTPNGAYVYVANQISGTVSVIATATNTVTATITVGTDPSGVAITPDGSKVYVTNEGSNNVSVISTASNTVTATIAIAGGYPGGAAVTPDGKFVYVASYDAGTVYVIATATDTLVGSPITTASGAFGVAITPNGSTVYIANYSAGTVSVIATATNTVVGSPITVGAQPWGLAVTPDGSEVFVANSGSGTVSVISTNTNAVTVTVSVGGSPIGPAVTPDGSEVYVSNSATATVSVISTASNTVAHTITVGSITYAWGDYIGPPTLMVALTGTGSGQVTSSPSDINCGASSTACSNMFPVGTQVTLTASASSGSTFAGWSGGGCSGTNTCVITPTHDTTITATFTLIPSFMLSVATAGTGSGTVTSSPSGITCGSTCSASFEQGTQVTLTGSAATGSTFAGWSGGGCSGTSPCSITISAATTVTATFVADTVGNLSLVAAVLPLSRSAVVGGTPATAFATIINVGPANASTCSIAPTTSIAASFVYQTTNPSTNVVTGTANTPVNIAAGQGQSFVIAFTPTAAFPPTNVAFAFTCANAPSPAPTSIGIDTLNLAASTSPVPDVVALAASGDPGYVDIPGATGTGVFAVATINLGSDATITAAANTGTANLPVTLLVCETNPTTGVCMGSPASSVMTDIPPNATPTFGIFVTGSASVANMPGVNRVFVTFTDSSGVLRGETSVAVRSQ